MIEMNEVTLYSAIIGLFYDKSRFVFKKGDKELKFPISKAPEPEDVIWGNIGLTDCSIYGRKAFTYLFTIALLGVSFAIVYGLSVRQNELTKVDQTDDASRYLSIVISVVIALINVILGRKYFVM